jgi:hypothetical protein
VHNLHTQSDHTAAHHDHSARGHCDVVADIARQYPIPVICALLGAPPDDWELFSNWTDDILKALQLECRQRIIGDPDCAGADGYLGEPVRKAVPLARIAAAHATPVVAGPVTIDRLRREVTVDGTPQTLTNTEFQLLSLLSVCQGEAVSREELMLEVWGTAVLGRTGRWTSSSDRSGPNSPDCHCRRCVGSVSGWTPDMAPRAQILAVPSLLATATLVVPLTGARLAAHARATPAMT